MKKLYKFEAYFRRQGTIEGLFIADEEELTVAIGQTIDFGEILGKHSSVVFELGANDIQIKSEDQDFIEKLEAIIGSKTVSGYNPLDAIEDENEC